MIRQLSILIPIFTLSLPQFCRINMQHKLTQIPGDLTHKYNSHLHEKKNYEQSPVDIIETIIFNYKTMLCSASYVICNQA